MKILWATKIGAPTEDEQLITEVESRIPAAMEWAKKNGFDRFRIADMDMNEKPDFTKTINKKKK